VERCRADGCRVIGVDLHNAEIETDLATPKGRARRIEEANRLAPEGLDGVVAGAGISAAGRAAEVIAINYFGAVATLEGLRALLARSERPRAVAVCSTAALLPIDEPVVSACLEADEARARIEIAARPDTAYMTSKRAVPVVAPLRRERRLGRRGYSPQWDCARRRRNTDVRALVRRP